MRKVIDLTGRKFGNLTVLFLFGRVRDRSGSLKLTWRCLCDCGKDVTILGYSLKNGGSSSCGCSRKKHGMSKSRTYKSWDCMTQRCTNPLASNYKYYGGRCVTIYRPWMDDFTVFLKDMGERPLGTSLGRIDGNKGYHPNNCEWQTPIQQAAERISRKKKSCIKK